jgi:hypothetical protein
LGDAFVLVSSPDRDIGSIRAQRNFHYATFHGSLIHDSGVPENAQHGCVRSQYGRLQVPEASSVSQADQFLEEKGADSVALMCIIDEQR